MESATTVEFAAAARTLTREARRRGLVGPSFRCPPRLVGVDRSIRRRPDGAVVSIRLKDRPRGAIVADMIEGVVVANGLQPPAADRLRTELWVALDCRTAVGAGVRRAVSPARPRIGAPVRSRLRDRGRRSGRVAGGQAGWGSVPATLVRNISRRSPG